MKFPMTFTSKLETGSGMAGSWSITSGEESSGAYSSTVAIPPEFNGPGGGLSPEDLFNQALCNCFVATFKVYAQNSKLNFAGVKAEGNLVVDLDDNKKPVMKSFLLKATITSPTDSSKAEMLARKAWQSGFILNSVKTKCELDLRID